MIILRRILFFIVLINTFSTMNAQLVFSVELISVTNYKISLNDSIYDEKDSDGPHILFNCKIKNVGDSAITIYPKTSFFYISFFCDGEEFVSEAIPIVFLENDSIKINSRESIYLYIDSYIFLGTKFMENKTGDYRNVLLKILPTIYIDYKDKVNKLQSCGIKKVILE